MQQDLWKDAREFQLSDGGGGILQLVGLDSPTHTLFGRISHPDARGTYSVQQVLEYMLHQVQIHNQEPLKLSATDLLGLGAVWKLTVGGDGTNSKLKRQRQFLENATDPFEPEDNASLRVHFRPSRFPAAYNVDWTLPPHPSEATTKPFGILDYNLDFGYVVVDKPSSLACHATVDNGVENVLYQMQQQLLLQMGFHEKPSLPQRLDIETQGLLLVALKPAFCSYLARLLEQKSLFFDSPCGMDKQYKCLVHLSSQKQLEELVWKLSNDNQEGILVEHYMDPKSVAPKTFQSEPGEGCLKCALRILDVGPVMKWIVNNDETANRTGVDCEDLRVQVRVELLTGRTHQIRGQFAAMNMPLVGDPLYGRQSCKRHEWDARRNRGDAPTGEMERLGLQCCMLSFPKPKWDFHAKKKKRVLVQDELGEYCRYQLDEAWWSDRLVRVD